MERMERLREEGFDGLGPDAYAPKADLDAWES